MGTPNEKLTDFRLDDIDHKLQHIIGLLEGDKGLIVRTHSLEERARRTDRTTFMVITALVGGAIAYAFDLLRRH